jgi:transcriptional regulator with XRE-family HTH domain
MLSGMKTEEQRRARELRARGCSIKEIERSLGVARSSVSRWVKDVQLGDEQRRALAARVTEGRLQAAERKARAARLLRAGHQQEGRRFARERDASYAAGCMLYWAEGDKARNQARLSNCDPDLLRFFVEFLRRHFDVRDDDIRVTCHLFADHVKKQREIEGFWLDTLGLTERSLCKSFVNVYSAASKKKRVNMLPYGTCRVGVSRTSVVQSIYGSIQEYGGFERPEWLD